uniref:Hes family bHLH transcription factor 1 n=1 Tax=Malurus cyaneus samueli TaxID=2593467 RepID=A0A8C5UNE5_9PASS
MPADLMEKSSASPVAATPARLADSSSRHSKLEKADILEMTVKHLRSLQRAQMTAALSTDPTVLGKYRAGFSECMNEVTRFLSTCEGVNTEVRTRLLGHLASCMTQINTMNYPAPPPPPPLPPAAPGADAAKVYGGFQLLPASDGQFAFLIPSTAFAPGGAVLPLYGGPPTAATAASPPGPPPGTADSVWRPW